MLVAGAVGCEHGLVGGRNGVAFASDLCGNSLEDLRGQTRVHEHRQLGLPKHIDKAGGYYFAHSINGLLTGSNQQVSNGRDPPCANPNLPGVPGRARSINNARIGDDDVETFTLSSCNGGTGRALRKERSHAGKDQQGNDCNAHQGPHL